MNLAQVSFPVYRLERVTPSDEGGVTFYIKREKPLVIDNKNIEGDTLAKRRLKLLMSGVKLYELKIAIFYLADLIKLAEPNRYFIDSSGKTFKYSKTRMVPLVFRKITKIEQHPASCIIEAEGIHGRHKVLYPPRLEQKYAGFLKLGSNSYIIYGFFEEQYKDTRRKV